MLFAVYCNQSYIRMSPSHCPQCKAQLVSCCFAMLPVKYRSRFGLCFFSKFLCHMLYSNALSGSPEVCRVYCSLFGNAVSHFSERVFIDQAFFTASPAHVPSRCFYHCWICCSASVDHVPLKAGSLFLSGIFCIYSQKYTGDISRRENGIC